MATAIVSAPIRNFIEFPKLNQKVINACRSIGGVAPGQVFHRRTP